MSLRMWLSWLFSEYLSSPVEVPTPWKSKAPLFDLLCCHLQVWHNVYERTRDLSAPCSYLLHTRWCPVGCPGSVALPPDYKSLECWATFSSPCIFSRMKSTAETVAGGDRRGRDKITLSEDQKGAERTCSCFFCLFPHLWDAPLRECYCITWGNKFDLKLLIFTVSFP